MKLCVLLYHRGIAGPLGNSADMLDRHFAHIARHHRCVLPGEPLERGRLNVCLSFDDAFYDFSAIVQPLLAKHDLRALLAVPTSLIPESTNRSPAERLAVSASDTFAHPESGGFCTWKELTALAQTGRVAFAAHGHRHVRLDLPDIDLTQEVIEPRRILEARLQRPIDSFVYPYGRFHRLTHQAVKGTYRHAFRIGQAANPGWDAAMLYRVVADGLVSPDAPFSSGAQFRQRWNAWWNRIRGV